MITNINKVNNNITFSGQSDSPIRELSRIKDYISTSHWEYETAREWTTVSGKLANCFTSDAAVWFCDVKVDVQSWATFEKLFVDRFFKDSVEYQLQQSNLTEYFDSENQESLHQSYKKNLEVKCNVPIERNKCKIVHIPSSELKNITLETSCSYKNKIGCDQRLNESVNTEAFKVNKTCDNLSQVVMRKLIHKKLQIDCTEANFHGHLANVKMQKICTA